MNFHRATNFLLLTFLPCFFFLTSCATIHTKRSFVPFSDYISTENDIRITVIDVGQGDSIYVRTPNGKRMLVDAGGIPSWRGVGDTGYEYVIPFLEKNIKGKIYLDAVVMTHPHADHVGGMMSVLKDIPIKKVYDSGYERGDIEYIKCLEIIKKKGIPYEIVAEGDTIDLDPDLKIEVFLPPQSFQFEGANNNSIVMKMTYKEFSVLLTGDAETEAENYISSKYKKQLKSNVLKSPHHGSRSSSTPRFINSVRPEVAVISCGRNNQFNHPSPETLSRYKNSEVYVYRTDFDGDVFIISNGFNFTVLTSK